MTVHRIAASAAFAGTVSLLLTAVGAGPALAHGAPVDPISRTVACSPEGGREARSAACEAAKAAGGAAFEEWDNLRIADVNGKDRQRIPDGKLCSAGIDGYRGLDLPRADWPSTRLAPGADLTLDYSSTIPHTGTFELYLTKRGYDPKRPLKWSDLDAKPFAKVKDPELTDGAYHLKAKLPSDRTGRQLLYTIWRNSSTPDTYYSCSDVVLSAGAKNSDARAPAENSETTGNTADRASDETDGGGTAMPLVAGGSAAAVLTAAGVFVTRRRRR
ncbi:lytic polysaccharide monooxygenase auxiliary activity family 9 protein [Streptomyces sp. RTd22]|uniref:lytic polysaccharide monooxygenase auxiliary activity family 9 protein n=1 Tax=Streptomyces sp. RTd22 TaxID=1841249 RepID=UPI0007C56BC4|nr:lytic polysaccharide monooxygenase [Streptomyces sp. RTd22]